MINPATRKAAKVETRSNPKMSHVRIIGDSGLFFLDRFRRSRLGSFEHFVGNANDEGRDDQGVSDAV